MLLDNCRENISLFSVCMYMVSFRLILRYMQVIQSWYVMGRLGAFNSSNLQVWPWYFLHHFFIPFTCWCYAREKMSMLIHIDDSWEIPPWSMIPFMTRIRVLKYCHHHFMISVMLSFRITGAVFGMILYIHLHFSFQYHIGRFLTALSLGK